MCGRYALYGPASRHRDHFGTQAEFELGPRYNVAPSQVMPVVRQAADGTREFTLAKWGVMGRGTGEDSPADGSGCISGTRSFHRK